MEGGIQEYPQHLPGVSQEATKGFNASPLNFKPKNLDRFCLKNFSVLFKIT